jgi:RNA polymerase sigma factor (sigma-70 family)
MCKQFNQSFEAAIDARHSDGAILYASIRRLLRNSSLSQFSENDVINEAYIRGVKAIKNGKKIPNVPAWIRVTSRYIVSEWRRKYNREILGLDESFLSDSNQPVLEEELREGTALINLAFSRLNPLEQRLLQLKVIEGLAWKRVQKIIFQEGLGEFSESALRQRKRRALKELRTQYHCIEN